MRAALLAALFVTLTSAQNVVLTGRVLGEEQTPLRKAAVSVTTYAGGRIENKRQATAADGTFQFSISSRNNYRVEASSPGFVTESRPVVIEGNAATPVEFHLVPEAVLKGHVRNGTGEPISGVEVQAHQRRIREGQIVLFPVGESTTTGGDGYYAIGSLAPGSYFLTVSRGYTGINTPEPREQYPTTFFPGVTAFAEAAPIPLARGEVRSADIPMRRVHMLQVKANVVGGSGRNRVGLRPDGPFFMLGALEASGSGSAFLLPPAPPGNALVGTSSENGFIMQRMTLTKDTELTFTIPPAFEVSGKISVLGASGTRISEVAVYTTDDGLLFVNVSRAKVDPEGAFTLKPKGAGPYALSLSGLGSRGYVRSVLLNGQDVTGRPLVFTGNDSFAIAVSADSPDLTGMVRDAEGKPVAGAYVAIWKPGSLPETSANSDRDGRFRFATRLPPGDYLVLASMSVEPNASLPFSVPALRAQFEDRATPVHLDEDGSVTVDPAFIPAAAIQEAIAKLP